MHKYKISLNKINKKYKKKYNVLYITFIIIIELNLVG